MRANTTLAHHSSCTFDGWGMGNRRGMDHGWLTHRDRFFNDSRAVGTNATFSHDASCAFDS